MKKLTIFTVLMAIFIISSCSGGNVMSPNPGNADNPGLRSDLTSTPVFVSEWDSDGNPSAGMGALGLFEGFINTQTMQGNLISLRSSQLTDVLEIVDITNFLALAPCTDCAKISQISLDADSNIVVTIGIKHPFGVGDPLKPITGRNRADLHVFNVEGLVAVQSESPVIYPSIGATIADPVLVNADGYSAYLDPYLDEIFTTDASIHPYILHFDDYTEGNFNPTSPTGFESVTTPLPSGNLVMPMGSDYDYQDYVFDIDDDSSIEFIYAVGCTYAVSSANKLQRFTPEYRVPQHNKKAASEVWVEIASNDLIAFDTASTAELSVYVLDISHGVSVGDGLDQMAADSSVSNIQIEIPGVTNGIQNDYLFVSGDGRDSANPLTFSATVTNTSGAGDGVYQGLVKVSDSYPVGSNTSPLLNGMDGIERVDPLENPLTGLFEITEFATYATFEISIESIPQDPVAVIITTPDPPDVTTQYPEILFDGSDSYDPDGGIITLFEWDFDWDGDPLNFVPDLSSADPLASYNYMCEEMNYTAGLRVTDDDTPAGVSDIAFVDITVTEDFQMGSFSASEHLGQGQTIRGSDLYHTGQAIELDSTGIAHIITKSSSGIHYRTWDGTSLSSSEIVPGSPGNPSTISIAVDADDEIHVVWQTYRQIRHTMTSGGSFTGSVDAIADAASGHSYSMMNMEANNDCDIMLTWYDQDSEYYGEMVYTLNTGTGFDTPQVAGPIFIRYSTGGSGLMKSFRMTTTPDGYFHYIYRGQTGDMTFQQRIYDMVYNGSSWESPRECSTNVLTDLNACGGADGSIHVTGRNHGTNNMEYIRYDPVNDQWMPNMVIATNSHPWIAGPMGSIIMAPSGFVHSVFVEEFDNLIHVKPFCEFWSQSEIQSAPDYVVDSTLDDQIWGHADVEWDLNGNLLIVHENDYDYYDYETVFNVLSYD